MPVCFWLASFEIHAAGVDEPGFVVEIEAAAQSVEPVKKDRAGIGFLFLNHELIFRLRQFPEKRAARGVGRLAAFNAVSIKARQPALRRSTVGTMRMLLFAVEVRTHRAPAGQFCNRRGVAFDFRKSGARRQAKLFGEDVEDAGKTNERRVFTYRAGRKLAQIELALFRWRHAWDLTTKTRSHKEAQKGQK